MTVFLIIVCLLSACLSSALFLAAGAYAEEGQHRDAIGCAIFGSIALAVTIGASYLIGAA